MPRSGLSWLKRSACHQAGVQPCSSPGGGIRTAGRADIYLGIGDDAEALAGDTLIEGQLYYLFLREDLTSDTSAWGTED